jgi:hypothetical protein
LLRYSGIQYTNTSQAQGLFETNETKFGKRSVFQRRNRVQLNNFRVVADAEFSLRVRLRYRPARRVEVVSGG